MLRGKGSPETILSDEDITGIIAEGTPEEMYRGKRVLVLTPDATRTCPLPMLVRAVNSVIGPGCRQLDFMVALGTHPVMSEKEILGLYGIPCEEKRIFKILGWIILGGCIYYWVHFFFIVRQYEPLLYTTYFTLILMGITFINEFKSTFLNSITCLTFYGFLSVTIAMFFQVNNLFSLFVGPLLHGAIGVLQLYMILHRKIPICKRYLIWGVLFYFIFIFHRDG